MRSVRAAVGLVAISVIGCQMFLDLNSQQCSTDAECDRVERGRVCRAGFCQTNDGELRDQYVPPDQSAFSDQSAPSDQYAPDQSVRDQSTPPPVDASVDVAIVPVCLSADTFYCRGLMGCIKDCGLCGLDVVARQTCDNGDPIRIVPGRGGCYAASFDPRLCCSSLDCPLDSVCQKGACTIDCADAAPGAQCNAGAGRLGTCSDALVCAFP
jgi:hypothetical protein